MNNYFQWPPLESDPEIFNNYLKSIGLPYNLYFDEILSLDYHEIQEINHPVLGIIASLQRTSKERYFVKENLKDEKFVDFYMKQTDKLDNACGLIAALHVIGNNQDLIAMQENSILERFYTNTREENPLQKALYLENFQEFKEKHSKNANEGQSIHCTTQSQVKHHYSGFVLRDGNLIELDGRLEGPHLIKTNCSNLVDDTIEEVKLRLMKGAVSDKINLIYLYAKFD
jgi:ubiquitin carboxyl-terminal hydrolase L3